jgi:hypothetical protein
LEATVTLTDESSAHTQHHTVIVSIDDNPVPTPMKTTPRALLLAAGLDPATRKLARVDGRQHEKFEDLDQAITVHEDEAFITVRVGPTPVS